MGDREQILADFQACTGLDDIETAITILEQHDWNLLASVQSVMPPVEGGPSSAAEINVLDAMDTSEISPFLDLTGASTAPSISSLSSAAGATSVAYTSNASTTRMIHFTIEYRDKTIPVILPDTETVGRIKEVLAQELSVQASDQVLKGWHNRKVDDTRILRDLQLPKEKHLYLLTPELTQPTVTRPLPSQMESLERLDQKYTLNINFQDLTQYRMFSLQFPGSKTIREVKNDIYALTDVPVRHQVWKGWPDNTESLTLAASEISFPSHNLEVASCIAPGSSDRASASTSFASSSIMTSGSVHDPSFTAEELLAEIDVSDEENSYAPLEDDMFEAEEVPVRPKMTSLIPDNISDDVSALEHFTKEFSERYGECHPVFYVGSLENAIKDSLLVKAKERKPLFVYLHHDRSIRANVFSSQVLCVESIVNFLSANFITWAWDLTHESNKNSLLTVASQQFGSVAASQIRTYTPDQLPVILIITRSRGTNEVFSIIQGHNSLDELMTSLIHAVDLFQDQLQSEIADEAERDARELIKQEQDTAYQESLAVDKAKDVALQEEVKKQKIEEQRIVEEQEVKKAIQDSLASMLPDEPPTDCKELTTTLRIRTPSGETITRRFLASHPLETVFNFITTKGYHMEDYKLLCTYPRRDVSQQPRHNTLEELKLYPQETLILEER